MAHKIIPRKGHRYLTVVTDVDTGRVVWATEGRSQATVEAFFAALLDNQPKENSKGLSNAKLAEIATGVGVPESVAATFADGNFEQWVTDATETASVDGLQGTPWIRAEQTVDIDGSIWPNTESLRVVLQYIHDYGLQAYLDSVVAAAA